MLHKKMVRAAARPISLHEAHHQQQGMVVGLNTHARDGRVAMKSAPPRIFFLPISVSLDAYWNYGANSNDIQATFGKDYYPLHIQTL